MEWDSVIKKRNTQHGQIAQFIDNSILLLKKQDKKHQFILLY